MSNKIDYLRIRRYAERLAIEKGISIQKAIRDTIRYKNWKNKREGKK